MLDPVLPRFTPPTGLIDIIGVVRKRWRTKLALRGAVRVGLSAGLLLLVAAYGIEVARFSAASVWAARVGLLAALAVSFYWFLIRPLQRRVSDDQVALYLEEHEPSLQATLLSAVEASRAGQPESAALVQRVVEQAIDAVSRANASRRADEAPLRGYSLGLAAVVLTVVAAVLVGPAFIRQALSAMFLVTRVQAAVPYSIEVKPGNTSVPRGSDQSIAAQLVGFDSEDATLMVKRAPDGKFEEIPLVRTENGQYEAMVFDVNAQMDYFVEADGVRTSVFTMKVVEVPYAQRIALEYRFPAYTGLEPQMIEDGGDVAVLRGTDVKVQVFPTMKTPGGRLVLGENQFASLSPQPDGSLVASFKANADGFYHVELEAPNGERVTGSPKYTIDVLEDRAPTVSFIRPGRDTTASAVEEVFVEAKAEDDFGVRDLELVYSVNGGDEKVVQLFSGSKRLPEVSAGHTFYLEELGVQVGDSVSYYARATDNDGAGAAKRVSSDLYFLRIRPFSKDFRQAQSQGGGGGGGGGAAGQVEALSEQQRQIISATFNVQRDRKTFTPDKLRQSSNVVALSQSRLREQVEGLITRMNSQLVQQDPAFAKIAELMPQAVAAMKEAETKLAASSPETALPAEHKALQVLQKAEEEYELQVSAGQQGGGGGGGGGGAMQQELADIFEQELDKMASRYETANQSMQQDSDRQVDELMEKLKELARRQEQEAERQRRRALESQQAGGGGGGSSSAQQRALADQVEEAARRLERLAREEERQDLADAARQMREAADAMRRAAAGGDANAAAQAQAALEKLRDTERRLQRGEQQRAERDIQQAQAQAEDLARRQQEIAEGAKQLAPQGSSERAQQSRALNDKKDALDSKLGELESALDRASRDAASDQAAASRKMAEAAGEIRDNRLRDKVRFSRQLVARGRNPQDVNSMEADIASGIDELRQRLDEAEAALGQATPGDKREQALDRARRLARGAESLAERTRERAQQQARNQQGQNQQGQNQGRDQQNPQGQQGQGQQARNQQGSQGQGQQGRQGQQGQQGQRGQGGQQGQGQGQGQGQSPDGQQGGDGQGGGNAGGDFANGGFDRGGAWNGGSTWGGWWDGRNAQLTPEDARQLRNEARQFLNDARDLRGQLRPVDIDPRELDGVMSALRELEDDRTYQDVAELVRLQQAVAEGLKRFEYALRRKVEGDADKAALSNTDNVPAEFRPLVEQYYRSLARAPR
jgi:hypothetical protein